MLDLNKLEKEIDDFIANMTGEEYNKYFENMNIKREIEPINNWIICKGINNKSLTLCRRSSLIQNEWMHVNDYIITNYDEYLSYHQANEIYNKIIEEEFKN